MIYLKLISPKLNYKQTQGGLHIMDYLDLGRNIKQERNNQNLTQEQLSEKAGISSVFLSQIENGRNKPSFETVYNIAYVLKVKIDDLLTIPKEHIIDNTRINALLKGRTENEKIFIFEVMKDILSKIDNDRIIKK